METPWYKTELEKYLKENLHESEAKTVFLSNPWQRKKLDEVFCEFIIPVLKKSVKDFPLKISSGQTKDLQDSVEEEWRVHTTKSLTFIIEDPERPPGPLSDIHWFCRGKIDCSLDNYMINLDFMLFFPESFSMDNLNQLLKDPAFSGMPPELHYENYEEGYGVYALAFSKGIGKGWGTATLENAGNHIFMEIQKMIRIIFALNEYETDYENTQLFNKLHVALVNAFGAE